MSSAPDLGPVPTRVTVEPDLVRRLVADQFPPWADLPVRAVAPGGWDNRTFRLGDTMSVRLPSAAEYALAVEKEHHWLPQLAARLPLPIPAPIGRGRPGHGYPFAWSVLRWLEGDTVDVGRLADPVRLGHDLAGFLLALQRIDPTDGPTPGLHNWHRGGSLRTFDALTQRSLTALRDHVDVGLVRAIWADALAARWDGVPSWFHGDIAAGNLLLVDGTLAAVIDFGTCGVGDPACDLAGAWTLLDAAGRRVFRDRLAVDDATWARGRGWALWKALATHTDALDRDEDPAEPRRVLEQVFAEYETEDGRRG